MPGYADSIDAKTCGGSLYSKLADGKVRCYACGHRCVIFPGQRGICKVRYNEGGELKVPFNYVAALQCDPTEKKPFFHVLPGSLALTFGMLGCDFHCAYCQNWNISQALRDPDVDSLPRDISAGDFPDLAQQLNASLVVSSYNEPLITAEWAAAVFGEVRKKGFKTAFVSNGNGTPEVLDFLKPYLDCYKVDLKSMKPENYRSLGGKLEAVLETIERLVALGIWLEVVTLVIPGFNDSDAELQSAAKFLAKVSPNIPWHVTAFHQDYKMMDPDPTSAQTLLRAAQIGKDAGLKFVYAGNLPGNVGDLENTYCPHCSQLLISRKGFIVHNNSIINGKCPDCATPIPGIWK